MDGVLWRDKQAIGDLPKIFNRIADLGLKVLFATNNATRNTAEYQEKLAGFGVHVDLCQIVNSAMACGEMLKERFPKGGKLYIIGSRSLINTLAEYGFESAPADEPVQAVVAGLDREISYNKLCNATRQIYHGALFIGTNPDRTFPTPDGLIPGAGSILAAIEAATYMQPIIAGKPSPLMYQLAMKQLDTLPHETIAIGDRYDTDIVGGQRAGLKTALVLSGVDDTSQSDKWITPPDIIAQNLSELIM